MAEFARFDELSRAMARGMPRRKVLKMALTGLAGGAVAAVLGPGRAAHAIACISGTVPCGTTCCPPSLVCLDPTTETCGCPPGGATCGQFCCLRGESCSDPRASCCCPKGSTPCGGSCCAAGVACIDIANGICGCQPKTTPCGSGASLTCCPAGTACPADPSGCPSASGNYVKGHCSAARSDVHVKDNITPVVWGG
jgi:hypothetical protein